MEPVTHVIGKQHIQIRYKGVTDTLALRNLISGICIDELPVRLNTLFDQYDDKNFVLRIDRLDVQVSVSGDGNLRETLAKAIIEKVEAALRGKLQHGATDHLPVDKSFARVLYFYLEKGYLPWWSLVKDRSAFQQALRVAWDASSLQQIIHEILPLLDERHVRNRLPGMLNEEQFDAFILATTVWPPEEWAAWKESFELVRRETAQRLSNMLFDELIRQAVLETIYVLPSADAATLQLAASITSILKPYVRSLSKEVIASFPSSVIQAAFLALPVSETADKPAPAAMKKETRSEVRDEKPGANNPDKTILQPQEGDSILVSNAGLVLVALYLPRFFQNVGLWNGKEFLDVHRAVALLHYLVFEEGAFEEFEIVLEKILCGLPLAESIDGRHQVTTEETEQIDTLLRSVIEHWTVLKNTTPAGLRHNFLRREGRLVFLNNQWELTVQKQAHDILLDYLPWNISMIKLPWMQHLLKVKWN